MRSRPVVFAALTTVAVACCFVIHAQQQNQPLPNPIVIEPVFLDPTQVALVADEISKRADRLQPMFDQVHAADWVAKGAPEAYVSQWNSLNSQNSAITTDMAVIAQHPEAMSDIMKALFRIHRFDADLTGFLAGVRRYQNPSLADLMESVASGDQNGVEKLQQYALDLAGEKERQLDVEDKEAQRCRGTLATQPPGRPSAPKTTNGTSK